MEDSDSVAVARVKAGDGDAYRALVDRHSRSVFRLADAVRAKAETSGKKPNILVLWGDDIGWFNVSAYNHG